MGSGPVVKVAFGGRRTLREAVVKGWLMFRAWALERVSTVILKGNGCCAFRKGKLQIEAKRS